MGVKKETTGSFQALDPSSSEYKKQKKNRQTNERNYLAAIKPPGVRDYFRPRGRDLVREIRTGGAPGQTAIPDSVDGATPGGSDGGGREQGTGSTFSVIRGQRPESTGDGRGRVSSGGTETGAVSPLDGNPRLKCATRTDLRIVAVARSYAKSIGISFGYAQVDLERIARIAQAYSEVKEDPKDRGVIDLGDLKGEAVRASRKRKMKLAPWIREAVEEKIERES